jgi:tether containing UBX domain for GLUT4
MSDAHLLLQDAANASDASQGTASGLATSASTSPALRSSAASSATPLPTDYKLFRPPIPEASSSSVMRDLPDEFYNPTAADLKAAQATLHARTEGLKNAPLRTQEMREKGQKEKEARWPTVRTVINKK